MEPRNREERRWQERQEKRRLKKFMDSRSPFGRLNRETMEKLVELAIEPDGRCFATVDDQKIELLADWVGKNDVLRPWATKKENNQILAASYHRLSDKALTDGKLDIAEMYEKRAMHTSACASSMIFASFEDEQGMKSMTPLHVHFCHDPLCPLCEWRRAVQRTALLMEVMNRISQVGNVRLLHLVLTVPNVRPDELGKTIDAMHEGLASMRKQGWWKKRVLGYFAKTEYTWSDNPDMLRSGRILHPHMHVLLVVPSEYFDSVPAWVNNLSDTFGAVDYNPRRSAGRCKAFEPAVSNVHAAIGRKLKADMDKEQKLAEEKIIAEKGCLSPEDMVAVKARLFSKYRKRFWRMVKHVDELAAEYRPAADADQTTIKEAVKAFANSVADVADPLYINEPKQHTFLNGWRKAMNNPSITDVQINAVTTRLGQSLKGHNQEAQMDAVRELAKYVCKDADFLFPNDPDRTDERVETLLREIANIHMISAGGIVADIIKDVKEDWGVTDEEEDLECEIVGKDGEIETCLDPDESAEIVVATWSKDLHAYTVVRYPMTSDALDALEYLKNITIPKQIRARCRDAVKAVQVA